MLLGAPAAVSTIDDVVEVAVSAFPPSDAGGAASVASSFPGADALAAAVGAVMPFLTRSERS
jgi:hypothetical protein